MNKEPGMFSHRYIFRRAKENVNEMNRMNTHHQDHDFPLAYSSNKNVAKERSSVSVKKKKVEEKKVENKRNQQQPKSDLVQKLQHQNKELKDKLKKQTKQSQSKSNQLQQYIVELQQTLKQKGLQLYEKDILHKQQIKQLKMQNSKHMSYKQTMKNQIYCLLNIFRLSTERGSHQIEKMQKEIIHSFNQIKTYLPQFNIQQELQSLASHSSIAINSQQQPSSISLSLQNYNPQNSIYTEQPQETNMIKIMQLHPLIETFNNNNNYYDQPENYQEYLQNSAENNKMERITKKLFDDSPLFKENQRIKIISFQNSLIQDSRNRNDKDEMNGEKDKGGKGDQREEKGMDLPREVRILDSFQPNENYENYIELKKGEKLKLLRKIRNNLWIGQCGDKIGLVQQQYLDIHPSK